MKLDLSQEFDRNKAEFYFKKLIEKQAKIEIKEVRKQRTTSQNSYLHICLGIFCAETGYSIEEAKEIFAQQLPELMYYEKKENRFRRSTTDLDTKGMTTLIEYIRSFCMEQLGVYVPSSDEYGTNMFELEKIYGV